MVNGPPAVNKYSVTRWINKNKAPLEKRDGSKGQGNSTEAGALDSRPAA